MRNNKNIRTVLNKTKTVMLYIYITSLIVILSLTSCTKKVKKSKSIWLAKNYSLTEKINQEKYKITIVDINIEKNMVGVNVDGTTTWIDIGKKDTIQNVTIKVLDMNQVFMGKKKLDSAQIEIYDIEWSAPLKIIKEKRRANKGLAHPINSKLNKLKIKHFKEKQYEPNIHNWRDQKLS